MRHEDFDRHKWATRAALYALHKAIKSREEIRKDVVKAARKNQVIRGLYEIVEECAARIKSPYHRNVMVDFAEFGLWIIAHDGAHAPQFYWMLQQVLTSSDKFVPHLTQYENPADWRINRWYKEKNPHAT